MTLSPPYNYGIGSRCVNRIGTSPTNDKYPATIIVR
eukprot:CAMPEP_0201282958 /NCGR_PEP_ID=MMETSP1317-20130820/7121_1 /ASSEMBLY_ACC=CAM_ASM_000770 /TAXON_ID=187299 /ORGANISM="Undescribed Undescribed, Strain Undescribed" /LENGTH=35 /DNA_ID= /DNA_START= /DNA_END= /DNA_ORIENTATION=